MKLLFTFTTFAAVSLGCFWMVVSAFRNPTAKVQDVNTGSEAPIGCAVPGFLMFGIGSAFVCYLMGRDIEPIYWWVAGSMVAPLPALFVLGFSMSLWGRVGPWVESVAIRLDEGYPPQRLEPKKGSVAQEIIRRACAVERPEKVAAGGYRDAGEDSMDGYVQSVREATTRYGRRRALVATLLWLPSLLGVGVLCVFRIGAAAVDDSAWTVLYVCTAAALPCTLLWLLLLHQIRLAREKIVALLASAAHGG